MICGRTVPAAHTAHVLLFDLDIAFDISCASRVQEYLCSWVSKFSVERQAPCDLLDSGQRSQVNALSSCKNGKPSMDSDFTVRQRNFGHLHLREWVTTLTAQRIADGHSDVNVLCPCIMLIVYHASSSHLDASALLIDSVRRLRLIDQLQRHGDDSRRCCVVSQEAVSCNGCRIPISITRLSIRGRRSLRRQSGRHHCGQPAQATFGRRETKYVS